MPFWFLLVCPKSNVEPTKILTNTSWCYSSVCFLTPVLDYFSMLISQDSTAYWNQAPGTPLQGMRFAKFRFQHSLMSVLKESNSNYSFCLGFIIKKSDPVEQNFYDIKQSSALSGLARSDWPWLFSSARLNFSIFLKIVKFSLVVF